VTTQAWPAQGTTLAVSENNNNTYTLINELINLTGFGGGTVTQALTTWLSSEVHTFRPTIPKPSETSFDLNFDPTDAVHKFIRNLKDAPNQLGNGFQATYNTGNTTSSSTLIASVSNFDGPNAGDVEENLTATVTLQPTGAPTWIAPT
jgi:hypothetical protein